MLELIKQGVKPIPDRWGGYGYFDAKNNNHKDIVKEYEKLDINYTQASHLIDDPNGKTDKMAIYDDELAVIGIERGFFLGIVFFLKFFFSSKNNFFTFFKSPPPLFIFS